MTTTLAASLCVWRFDGVEGRTNTSEDALRAGFQPIAARYGMQWTIRACDSRKRVMILVSKLDHCLNDLLYRYRTGELTMDISAVVANHPLETMAISILTASHFTIFRSPA